MLARVAEPCHLRQAGATTLILTYKVRLAKDGRGSVISVVIPAHNEASVIGSCLSAVVDGAAPGELDVVVVCNGCTDATSAIASSFGESVRVVQTPEADKAAALNLGDQRARSFPRIYLDADIVLPPRAIPELGRHLSEEGALAATVAYRTDLSEASWLVRRHYAARARAPFPNHLVGRGVYGLSEEGRRRFGAFPRVIADDLFVQGLFSPDEVALVDSFVVTVRPPRTGRELVRTQSRVGAGTIEHNRLFPEQAQRGSHLELVRAHASPRRWLDLALYVGTVGAAKGRARYRLRRAGTGWESDHRQPTDTGVVASGADDGAAERGGGVLPARHLGLPMSLTSWPELSRWARQVIGEKTSATIYTIAPYQAHLARTHESYGRCLEEASAVLVDGNGIRFALALAGAAPPSGRMTGRELARRIFEGSLAGDAKVAVVGGADEALARLGRARPDWTLVGWRFADEPEPAQLEAAAGELEAVGAELALVALGSPKGELWAHSLASLYPCLYASVGGAVDTLTGVRKPPPRAVTRIGLEWAWRLFQDPALARHVAHAATAMPILFARAARERARASKSR